MSTASPANSALRTSGQRGVSMPPAIPASLRDVGRAQATAANPAPFGHALAIIRKLQICLDEETTILTASGVPDLDSFNQRKGQGLMELNRALLGFGTVQRNSEVEAELAKLKGKIDENMRHLRLHISAVNEITGMLTDAIQREESDGTYSPSIRAQWK